jgi:hypothetical protein
MTNAALTAMGRSQWVRRSRQLPLWSQEMPFVSRSCETPSLLQWGDWIGSKSKKRQCIATEWTAPLPLCHALRQSACGVSERSEAVAWSGRDRVRVDCVKVEKATNAARPSGGPRYHCVMRCDRVHPSAQCWWFVSVIGSLGSQTRSRPIRKTVTPIACPRTL